jgi:hypothetical protein
MSSKPTSDASTDPRPASSVVAEDSVTYWITLKVERVVPWAEHRGAVLAVQAEPRFVVLGYIIESRPSGRFAPDVREAFAVHDLESLGLGGWRSGSTAELELTVTRRGSETSYRLVAVKPR